jgi:DNA-binding NtrC family response regulator
MSRRTEGTILSTEGTAAVLAVSPLSADLVRLREVLSQGTWKLHEASGCCEALALLRCESVQVLLCERDHSDGNWEELLRATATLPDPPNLVVFSRQADESLWAMVLNLGSFDVLIEPFEPEKVLRAILPAWSHWGYDFVANTAQEAQAADRRKMSALSG